MAENSKKSYKSVQKTKRALALALLKLAKVKPLDKITVTEVCFEAQISRNAYYAHYEGLYAQVEKLEGFAVAAVKDMFARFLEQPTNAEYETRMAELAEQALRWRVISELVLYTSALTHFVLRVKSELTPFMTQLAEKLYPDYTPTQKEYYSEMVTEGLIALFKVFLRESEPDAARFAEFSERLIFFDH